MGYQFLDFFPVDLADIQAKADPSARADVGGHVELLRIGGDEGGVVAGKDFAGDSDDAVAVVIVEEIGEDLLADFEAGVTAHHFPGRFGQRETDLGEAREPAAFLLRGLGHNAYFAILTPLQT